MTVTTGYIDITGTATTASAWRNATNEQIRPAAANTPHTAAQPTPGPKPTETTPVASTEIARTE